MAIQAHLTRDLS